MKNSTHSDENYSILIKNISEAEKVTFPDEIVLLFIPKYLVQGK